MKELSQQTKVRYLIIRGLNFFSIFVLTSLVGWGIIKLFDPHVFPVRHVVVMGNHRYLKTTEVQQLLKRALYFRSFFSASVNELRSLLEDIPSVGRVEVRRIWPDTLGIRIEERQFAASWGRGALLSTDGKIIKFPEKTAPSITPLFWGEPRGALNMLDKYRSFSERLKPLGLKISEMSLDERQSWRVKLANGIVVELGRNEFVEKFDRFINFYEQYLSEREEKVASVDMRYTHGASVSWKSS